MIRLALKTIQKNSPVNPGNEIRLLMKLHNPYIINYIDAFVEGALCCIITDYCEVRTKKSKFLKIRKFFKINIKNFLNLSIQIESFTYFLNFLP